MIDRLKRAEYAAAMTSIIARFAERDGEFETPIPNLFFNRRTSPSQPLLGAQWPCFAMVTQGAKSLTVGSKVFEYGVGDFLVVALDLPVASRVTRASAGRPHFGLGMAIDHAKLRTVIQRSGLDPEDLVAQATSGVSVDKASMSLLDCTLRLLRLVDTPGEISALAPLYEEEVLFRLLTGPQGAALLRIAATDSPSNRIARAIAWLRQNYTKSLKIESLAATAGMSISSLHHHFKAITAMTPVQYQKRLRLHEARRLMLVDRLDVGSAGFTVGYQSPSQFSREYSRLYGISPLRDAERSRTSVDGDIVL